MPRLVALYFYWGICLWGFFCCFLPGLADVHRSCILCKLSRDVWCEQTAPRNKSEAQKLARSRNHNMKYIKGRKPKVYQSTKKHPSPYLKYVNEILILLTLHFLHHYSFCGNRNLPITQNWQEKFQRLLKNVPLLFKETSMGVEQQITKDLS